MAAELALMCAAAEGSTRRTPLNMAATEPLMFVCYHRGTPTFGILQCEHVALVTALLQVGLQLLQHIWW